jgi:DNA-binding NarL/FixJ family response regulator
MSNKEVARSLKCTETAVKHHMTNIMQKLNVRNRFEAAMKFSRRLITVHGDFDSLTWFNGTDG